MNAIRKAALAMLVVLGVAGVAGVGGIAQSAEGLAQNLPAQAGSGIAEAKHFVTSLYAHYRSDGGGVPNGTVTEADVYEPSLLALMHADQQAAGQELVGYLDGSPLCECQDFDHFQLRAVQLAPKSGSSNHLVATVSFRNLGRNTTLRLELDLTARGWRIYDVISASNAGNGSLRAALQKSTLELKQNGAAH
jgi:Protein of unknown function (DUF3828)